MIKTLSRFFNLKTEEVPRLLLLSAMVFTLIIGTTWAQIVIPASFIVQVGVEFLPYLFIADALTIILASAIYSAFVDRISNTRILYGLVSIGLIAVAAGRAMLEADLVQVAYPFLYLVFRILTDIVSIHWATYVNGFYDTRSAKRIFPILASANRIGVIVAALSVRPLNSALPSQEIIILWGLTLVVFLALALAMPYVAKDHIQGKRQVQGGKRTSYVAYVREGYSYVLKSPFLRWMGVSAFVVMVAINLLSFEALGVFRAELETPADISNFTALLVGVSSIFILPFQLFVYSRLVGRVGVGNANMIYPVLIVAVSAAMLIVGDNLGVSGLAFVTVTTLNLAFRATAEVLLYNAVPLNTKGRARAFINGLLVPLGTMFAGLLTLLPVQDLSWFVPSVLMSFALVYFFASLWVRRTYGQALVTMLQQENFSFLLNASDELIATDNATLQYLKERLYDSPDDDTRLFIARIMAETGSPEVPNLLIPLAQEGSAALRAGLIEILTVSGFRSAGVRNLCFTATEDAEASVRRAAVIGLAEIEGTQSRVYLDKALSLVYDADLEVQNQILPSLIQTNDPKYVLPANERLTAFLADDDPALRIRGIQVLERVGSSRIAVMLVKFLSDENNGVRVAAAIAIETLADSAGKKEQNTDFLARHMLGLLYDPIERVRLAVVRTLSRIDTPDMVKQLLPALVDTSPRVRQEVVKTFLRNRATTQSLLENALQANLSDNIKKMLVGVLVQMDKEAHLPAVYEFVRADVKEAYQNEVYLASLSTLGEKAGLNILRTTIMERNRELADEIFYLLGATHGVEDLSIIRTALASDQARNRANAIEALEALLPADLIALLPPLLNPNQDADSRAKLGQDLLSLPSLNMAQVLKDLLLHPMNPWFAAVGAFVLGEMGLEVKHDEEKYVAASLGKRRQGRGLTTVFGALMEGEEKTSSQLQEVDTQMIRPRAGNSSLPLSLDEIRVMLRFAQGGPELQAAANAARRVLEGRKLIDFVREYETTHAGGMFMLSAVEKIIFLKGVPFFEGMTISQLKVLANTAEEAFFPADSLIFDEGEIVGSLYVVVDGKVGIERMDASKGTSARIANLEARSYFGEATLFDNSASAISALALQDTLTLRLRHEPLIALIQAYPDLSLQLVKVLSKRLRDMDEQVASLSRRMSRSMHKVYDKLD
jgi:HEAT repeat protein